MGTITKNYIIIIFFEKIIMKKECQYCHHLKHHHHQRHHHPLEEAYCMHTEHVILPISLLWTNQLQFFCPFLFLLTWSYVPFLSNFSLLSNLIFFAGCSTLVMCRHISWTLDYELPGLSSNLINSYTTLYDLIAIEGIPHR